MNRHIRVTGDGSHTLYNNDLNEPYHSINGAIYESMHVFIANGFNQIKRKEVKILEIGFGTGLNMLLTYKHSEIQKRSVYYHAVDKYPLNSEEYEALNYPDLEGMSLEASFLKAHASGWNREIKLRKDFTLYKELADFREMNPGMNYHIVYFDAFAPDKQPEVWIPDIFKFIYDSMAGGGILVSYTSKGAVRRNLRYVGFQVEKLPGPPGKREMLRAFKQHEDGIIK